MSHHSVYKTGLIATATHGSPLRLLWKGMILQAANHIIKNVRAEGLGRIDGESLVRKKLRLIFALPPATDCNGQLFTTATDS